ncbi:MAG: hypothetical protein Q4Q23_05875, partial [Methanobacteriaceae archaeon]|nr:hypothetical protein [Methanobacteriaceae archaeon]
KTILNFNKKSIFQLFLFMVIFGFFIMGIYLSYQHTLPFIGQFTEVSVSSQVSSANPGYSVDTMYYFYNLPQYLSSNTINVNYDQLLSTSSNQPTLLSYVFLIMCLIGIGLTIRNSFKKSTHKKNSIILLTLMLITLLTFTKVSYIITMILFTITIILYYFLLDKTLKQIDATMIIWLGISLILHSYHPVKVDRYIITSIIPLIYFIIQSIPLTLNLIEKHIDINKKTKYIKIISIILILLILPITLSYTESLNHTNSRTQIEKESAQWLQEYDPDYKTANISSDRGPIYSWYLKKYVYSIVPRVLKLENDTLENRLETINAKYYIDSTSNINSINGYHKIHEIKSNKTNSTIIYEKN